MAFKVENDRTGYKISTGDGGPARARDMKEVKAALEHYYLAPYHSSFLTGCPLCQQMKRNGLAP